MHRVTRLLFFIPLFIACSVVSLHADILIEPSVIFMNDGAPSRTFSITSREQGAVVVFLHILSGNAGSKDAAGENAQTERSLVPYLKLADTRVVLAPGQKRQITCDASPPAALSQGEYWARIVATWAPEDAAPANAAPPSVDGPSAAVNVVYRKGEAFADVKLVNAGGTRDDGQVHFYVDLIPLGNAAYRGNMIVEIKNKKNKTVYSTRRTVDVYERQRQVFEISGKSMPPGLYRAVLHFNTEREDLGAEAIPVLPKEYKIDFNMP